MTNPWTVNKKCSWCGEHYSNTVAMGNSYEMSGFCSEKCYREEKNKNSKKESHKKDSYNPLNEALKPSNSAEHRLAQLRLEELQKKYERGEISRAERSAASDKILNDYNNEQDKRLARRVEEIAKEREEDRARAIVQQQNQEAAHKARFSYRYRVHGVAAIAAGAILFFAAPVSMFFVLIELVFFCVGAVILQWD